MIDVADADSGAWTTVLGALVGMLGEVISVDIIAADTLRLVAVMAGTLERGGELSDDDDELCVSVDGSVFFLPAGRIRHAENIFGVLTVDLGDAVLVFRALGTEEAD